MIITAKLSLSKKNAEGKPLSSVLADGSVIVREATLGDLTIRKVKVVQGKDGNIFVSLPQNLYQDKKTGEDKYSAIVLASADWKAKIDEVVLQKYSELMRTPAPVPAAAK